MRTSYAHQTLRPKSSACRISRGRRADRGLAHRPFVGLGIHRRRSRGDAWRSRGIRSEIVQVKFETLEHRMLPKLGECITMYLRIINQIDKVFLYYVLAFANRSSDADRSRLFLSSIVAGALYPSLRSSIAGCFCSCLKTFPGSRSSARADKQCCRRLLRSSPSSAVHSHRPGMAHSPPPVVSEL